MNIVDFLSELRQLDIQISLNGDKLKIKAPQGALTKEIKIQLKDRKEEIIAFFSGAKKQDESRKILRVENPTETPLSFGQQRLWFFEQANPGTVANNMSSGIRLKGPLNTDVIQRVFNALLERHESLRTTFYTDEEGVPFQQVNAAGEFSLQHIVVEGDGEQQEHRIDGLLAAETKQPFSLTDGPLVRATLVQLSDQAGAEEHVLIIGMHHIISDGFSVGIFMREIAMLYLAFAQNMPSPLPPLEVQYPDFSIWQRQFLQGEDLEKQLNYWEETLTGAPILSTFPSDFPRPPIQTSNGANQRIAFTGDFGERLAAFANKHEITPFIVLLAAWKMLLQRYSNQHDLCVGIPTSGRNQLSLEPLIGFFVNSMVIRSEIDGQGSIQDALESVRHSVVNGLDNGDIPIEMAVERLALSRNPAYTPLVQIAFQLMVEKGANQNVDVGAAAGELTVEALKKESVSAKFDMTLSLTHSDTGVQGALEYNTDLYSTDTIQRISAQFMQLAEYLITGDLDIPVNRFSLLSEEELVPFVLGEQAAEYEAVLPMTAMQRDLYLSSLRNDRTLENSLGYAVEIHHEMNVDIWQEELTRFSNSQSILRADIKSCAAPFADSAYLCIRPAGEIALDVIDLTGETVPDLQRVIDDLVRRPYVFDDNCTNTVVYYHLIKLADAHWVAILATHHLIMDGIGYAQQLNCVFKNYEARMLDSAADTLLASEDVFADYIEYDRQEVDKKDTVDFWRKELTTVEPVDYKVLTPTDQHYRKRHLLTRDHWDAIRKFSRKQKITPTLYFKALYGLLINHYCRADHDFVLSEFAAGRPKGHGDAVGCYYLLNPFVCKHALYQQGDQISAIFEDARAQQKDRRGKTQLSVLQQSQLMEQGRIGFMFNYVHFYSELTLLGQNEVIQQLIPDAESQVQLVIKVIGDDLHLFLDYHGTQFEDHDFLARLDTLSQQIVDGAETVEQLSFASADEQAMLSQWSSGSAVTIAERPIHRPFEDMSQQHPENIAIVAGAEQWTYGELETKANQLANKLLDDGVNPGSAIAICLSPSPWWIAGVMAIIKAGCRYIPVATDYPVARIKDIMTDAKTSVVLVDEASAEILANALGDARALRLHDALIADYSVEIPRVDISGNALLYTIYTSGSTGKPKGASVTHRNAENLLAWYTDEYQLNAQSQNLIISSIGFDLTQKNIFAPLRVGGAIVLPVMDAFDPQVVNHVIRDNAVTHMNCAPSALYGIVESDDVDFSTYASLQYVLLGGEPIQLNRLRQWSDRSDCHTKLVNMYGPTECTDIASSYVIEDIRGFADQLDASVITDIPIGVPNHNVHLHVLDQTYQAPVVPGCVGELCISGDSVGAGYLNRDQLNADAFFEYRGERTYKTGDLVRYNDKGELVYIGRKDFQVKLRGLRIELDEIRFALTRLDTVRDSMALVDDDRLLGFVVADTLEENYRPRLNEYLPAYMIPSSITLLDAWPLTPNGKVDRKALLALASDHDIGYEAPETATEVALAGIWSEVLNIADISVSANFFDLGGHSLLATKIASRSSQVFEVHLTVRAMFESPTVRTLAAHIDAMLDGGEKKTTIPVVPRDKLQNGDVRVPLSFAQQRLWLLDKIDGGSTAYNVPLAMRIKGSLDLDTLNDTIHALLARHEGLRTVFREDESGAYQWILDADQYQLQQWALEDVDVNNKEDVNEAIRNIVAREILRPFDLETGPLIRASAVKITDKDYLLIIVAHHIVTDGWSMNVLGQELATLYVTSTMKLASPLDAPALQYLDYAQWQRDRLDDAAVAEHLAYWEENLRDLPNLHLPTDFVRPPVQTYGGASVSFSISKTVRDSLEAIALSNGATLFNALMAAYGVLLNRYTGQTDFAIGTPVAGRDHPDLEKLVGFFVNTLVIRMQLAGVDRFDGLVQSVNQSVVNGYEHQEIPFEQIVETISPSRDMSRAPLFQAMLVFQNMDVDQQQMNQNAAQAGDISLHPVEFDVESSKFDMTLSLADVASGDSGAGLSGVLQYNKDLFERSTMESIANHFVTLCERLAASPESPLADISMLSEEEIHQQLVQWNDTAVTFDRSRTVDQLFSEQVDKTPGYVAVSYGQERLTYQDVDRASNILATHLINLGVTPGDRVGVCFDRSLHIMSAIIAVLKAGGTYVPLDASYPAGRIQYIVEDAGISRILTRAAVAENLPVEHCTLIDVPTVLADCDATDAQRDERIAIAPDPERLLYLIYTSGSTGRPKGTGAYHYSEVNLLNWYVNHFAMDASDRVMLMSALGFDLTQKNLFAPLCTGASLVIPTVQEYDPEQLVSEIENQQVTWINCAPSAFYDLQEDERNWPRIDTLRHVFLGGEPINLARLDAWRRGNDCKLVNSYGPTECTDIAAYHVVNEHDTLTSVLPIGRPNDNVNLYILGENDGLLPVGAVGELCIGGASVGPGYLNRDALTDEVFVAHPFGSKQGEKIYRTGDLVRYRKNGDVEYLGRRDHQIKLRGFRIEVGEIQAVINEQPSVVDSVVATHALGGTTEQLVAWVVVDGVDALSEEEQQQLQARCKASAENMLPSHMVPAAWKLLAAFPLTPNGKVDRKALPAPTANQSVVAIAPRNEQEQMLSNIWSAVLGVPDVGVNQNFFELGGHSLLATKVVARVVKQTNANITVRSLFEAPTIEQFSEKIASAGLQQHRRDRIKRLNKREDIPLSYGQMRLLQFDQMNPGSSANNMPIAVRVKGVFDREVMQKAYRELLRRHESLRTTFYAKEDGEYRQRVHIKQDNMLQVISLVGQEDAESKVLDFVANDRATCFDLMNGPLVRGALLVLNDVPGKEESVLTFCMHHIISDGVSMSVLLREMTTIYVAFAHKMPSPLPELALQYADFAHWQQRQLNEEVMKTQLDYWESHLANAPALLTLPTDRPRPSVRTTNGKSLSLTFAPDFNQKLTAFSREHGVTPFMVMLFTWQLLLSKYSQQQSVSVGVPMEGRPQAELENIIGFFINSMILNADLPPFLSLKDGLEQVRTSVLNGFANGDVPLDKVIERMNIKHSSAYTPIAQVAFQLMADAGLTTEEQSLATEFGDLSVEVVQTGGVSAKFDMLLSLHQTPSGLSGDLEFNTDLFDDSTIEELIGCYIYLSESLIENPDQLVGTVALTSHDVLMDTLALPEEEYDDAWPLTAMQRDLFFSSVSKPDTLENSLGYGVELHHCLDVALWREELTRFTNQQSILRAKIINCSAPFADSVYLGIRKPGPITIDVIDLSREEIDNKQLQKRIEAIVRHPYVFDNEGNSDLVTYHLIKVAEDHWVTIMAAHHLVLDGVGIVRQLEVVLDNYQKRCEGAQVEALTKDEDLFAAHVKHDRQNADSKATVEYWKEQLASVEPLDYNVQAPIDARVSKHQMFSSEHLDQIRKFCRKKKITPTLYFKCLYGLLIKHYCRADADFVFSELYAGRPKGHGEAVGCYYLLNPFICKQDVYTSEAHVDDLFTGARADQKERRDKLQLSILQQSLLMPQGRLGFMYNYIHFYPELNVMGVDEEFIQFTPNVESHVQLIVKMIGPDLHVYLDYHGADFEDHDFLGRLEHVSQQIVNGVENLADISLVTPAEQATVNEWATGAVQDIYNAPVHRVIEQRVASDAASTAIVCGTEQWDYQQLNDSANKIAHYLIDSGVQPGAMISVFMSRTPWWIATVLGVVKAGCNYIPVAADYPESRVMDIVEDAQSPVMFVDGETATRVPAALTNVSVFPVTDDALSDYAAGNPEVDPSSDALLYTIYTSGSTGKPKGASVTHRNAENLYHWYADAYTFDAAAKTLIISSPGFDLTQKNIFTPLRTGGTVVLPGVDNYDPKIIGRVIAENKITHMNCAPSALYGLLESDDVDLANLDSLAYVLLGGEPIQLERLAPWANRDACQTRLVNMYGPTECTDIATSFTVENIQAYLAKVDSGTLPKDLPIGSPNANVTLHVLDSDLLPVVPGCIGELCISGESVGAGYLNRDELNAEAFVTYQGSTLYRTGDLVRYDSQGQLIYVDRKDFQTKVRGYRIELGEIESVLIDDANVVDAVVIVREDMPGGAGLAAYVQVPSTSEEQQGEIALVLRDAVRKQLPDYMVPGSISVLAELPLNASGKVDRKALAALPLVDFTGGAEIVPPQTELQAQLVDIWQTVLGVENLGIKQDFFQLGGHSLLATKVVSRVAKITDATVSVRTLFEAPTIELFAEQITLLDERESRLPAVTRLGATDDIPLSFGQSRLWFFDQMNPGSSANNMPSAIKIKGEFAIDVLQHAFAELIRRHETLRTTFYSGSDGKPLQRIAAHSDNQIHVMSYVGDEDAEANALVFAAKDRATGFDLEQGPLVRGTLIKLKENGGATESILTFCMHHIITDGMSLAVLLRELTALYMAKLHNVPSPLPPLTLQYADFAQWQQTYLTDDTLEEQINYWEAHLRDAPALLELPTDRPRPPVQTTNGNIRSIRFSQAFNERLNEFSRENGLTPFMVMLFSWKMLLSKYAQQDSISVGVPTSGRTQQELENIIGFFINSVVLNTALPATISVADGLKRVRETVLGGFANENVPIDMVFERLDVDRNPSYTPLVQVAFQLVTNDGFSPEQEALAAQFGDLSVEPLSLGGASAKFDMTMTLTQSADGLFGDLEFNTDLFDESTIDAVVEHYQYLSQSIMDDPLQLIGNADLCSKEDLIRAVGLPAEEYEDIWPLSAMQYDMVMDNIMNPMTLQSSHGCAVHLHNSVDSELWQRCIQAFSDRSGIFRARFAAAKSAHLDMGYFAIRKAHKINYEFMDLSDGEYSDADVKVITDKFVYIPYDMVNDELVRFLTIKLTEDHYVVVAAVHHAIQDGAALHVFWEAVTTAYQQQLDNPGAPWDFPEDNFPAFVAEDRLVMDTPDVVEFWRGKLASVEPLDFSVPTPIPEPGAYRSQEFWLEDEHWAEVKAYCRKKRITPALYFKVLYGLVINAYCRPDGDFSIQETMAGRTKNYYTTQGCFIQEIPFVFNKSSMTAESSIVDLYKDARAFQKAIKNYRLISIGEQMALSPRGRVSFMYNYYLFIKGTEFLGEEIFIEGTPSDPTGNVQVVVTEVRGDLRINLLYHPHLFEDFGLVDRMVSISRQLVLGGVESLGQLEYVTEQEETRQLLDTWNDTKEDFDLSKTLHARFEEQVEKTPDTVAVVDDTVEYSYQQLNQRANQLARYLREAGVDVGHLVGLCAERSADFLVGILGIMKAGGAYVPMDPKYPQDRITYMRDNSEVSVLLSQTHLADKVEGSDATQVIYLDGHWEQIASNEHTNLALAVPATSRAYMIYTSGSTGLPKGAIVRHDGALNHIEAERQVLSFDAGFNFLQTAPSSSDISVWQFLGPVICGGKSVVLDEVTNAKKMFELVKTHQIDIVELVPVALQLLMEYIKQLPETERHLPALRWMMATGEAVSVDLVNGWLALYPDIPVVNAYGPTEAADDVIQCAIDKPLPIGQRSVPIGKPLANLQVLILDDCQRLVPAGIPGEICIAGVGVGEGYWNNPEKTADAFIDHPIDPARGKVYRTGDLGRWLADGSIEYLDRVDNQVKVRGFRIELGEVEAAVTALPTVREAVVIVRDDMPGGAALAAYVVPSVTEFDVTEARNQLRSGLPDYMVPTALVALETLPLTPAGKVDRKSLPKPEAIVLDSGEYIAPRTAIESTLVDMWESLLPVERVGVTDNFFDIGGHSLIGVRLMARIGQEFSISLQITELLNAPTIEKLATVIEEENGSTEWTPLVTLKRVADTDDVTRERAVFFVHPVGGDVMCYTELAAALPDNVPVYGLQSRGFVVGMDTYSTLGHMVDAYVEAIISVQPEGPYRLAAQSLGGVITLEIAKALQSRGKTVERVFMFDTFTPEAMTKDQPSDVEIIEAAIGQALPRNVKQLVTSGDDAWLEMLYQTARAAKILPEDFTFDQIQSVYRVALTNHELVSKVELGSIDHPVYHFAAADSRLEEGSQVGWKALDYAFEYHASAGEHESMIRGENAVALGQKMHNILIKA